MTTVLDISVCCRLAGNARRGLDISVWCRLDSLTTVLDAGLTTVLGAGLTTMLDAAGQARGCPSRKLPSAGAGVKRLHALGQVGNWQHRKPGTRGARWVQVRTARGVATLASDLCQRTDLQWLASVWPMKSSFVERGTGPLEFGPDVFPSSRIPSSRDPGLRGPGARARVRAPRPRVQNSKVRSKPQRSSSQRVL